MRQRLGHWGTTLSDHPAHQALVRCAHRQLASGHPAAGFGGDLRALLHAAATAADLGTAVERARTAPANRRFDRLAAVFAAVADTPHLLELAPHQVIDDGFLDRAVGLAGRLAQAVLEELPLALLCWNGPELSASGLRINLEANTELACRPGVRPLGATGYVLEVGPRAVGRASLDIEGSRAHLRLDHGRVLSFDPMAPSRVDGTGARLRARPRLAGSPSLRWAPQLRSRRDMLQVGDEVDPGVAAQLGDALQLLHRAWPDGWRLVHDFTETIVPLYQPGTVSYSMAARPGYSYIHLAGKSLLQQVDDLVHESAHHRLHAVEELDPLTRDDGLPHHWSPWRRAWRPLRGIYHATYTFTFAAVLFAHLMELTATAITPSRRRFARKRLLEEHVALEFSLADLVEAAADGRLAQAGRRLLPSLVHTFERLKDPVRDARRALSTDRQAGATLTMLANRSRALARRRQATPTG